MKTKILIIAYRQSGLTQIFRQAAVVRLAQLAASLADEVWVFMTEEIYQGLKEKRAGLPVSVASRVISLEEMSCLPDEISFEPDEPVAILKGHSVWDRHLLDSWLTKTRQRGEADAVLDFGGVVSGQLCGAIIQVWSQEPQEAPAVPSRSLPYLLNGGKESAATAEALLVAAQAKATSDRDGVITRVVDRRLSRQVSPWLARWGVRPNWITLSGTLIGLLGAWLLAQGNYRSHLLGAALFLSAVVIDGVDGEVARLTLSETSFGHYLDVVTDNLVHAAVFIGMAVGLSRATHDVRYLYVLMVMLGGVGLCGLSVYLVLQKTEALGPELQPQATRWLSWLANRDFAYLVFLLALIDRLAWFLWSAMIGSYLFAFCLLILWRFSLKRQGSRSS